MSLIKGQLSSNVERMSSVRFQPSSEVERVSCLASTPSSFLLIKLLTLKKEEQRKIVKNI